MATHERHSFTDAQQAQGTTCNALPHFSEWRSRAYKAATLVWCSFLLLAYIMTLMRMPMRLSPQVCLLSTLFSLTCVLLVTALKGSARSLRTCATVLMFVRSTGYICIGLGLVPLDFKPQLFASPSSKVYMPLGRFSFWAALLFDSVGLVHTSAPRLQLCYQIVSGIITNLSLGGSFAFSIMKSVGMHGLCGLIHAVLEWRDRRCFEAVCAEQQGRQARLKAQWAKTQEGQQEPSPGVAIAEEPGQQSSRYTPTHGPTLPPGHQPVTRTHDFRLGSVHNALQGLLSGPEGEARRHQVKDLLSKAHLVSSKRHSYTPQQGKRVVVLKVPGPTHPADLPEDFMPGLRHHLNERLPDCVVTSMTVRSGCVLVTLDLREDLRELARVSPETMEQALAGAAQAWLQETQLAAQIPASTPVLLQVDGVLLEMRLDASTSTWSVLSVSLLDQGAPSLKASIQAASPAVLLPCDREQERCAQPGNKQQSMVVQALVTMPDQVMLSGWEGDAAQQEALDNEGVTVSNAGQQQEGSKSHSAEDAKTGQQQKGSSSSSSKQGSKTCIQVLANVGGYGYLPTEVDMTSQSSASAQQDGLVMATAQVSVCVPADVATQGHPCMLVLELWHLSTLLSTSSMALIPACMHEVAAELQSMPWGGEDDADVADFISDLGRWMCSNHPASPHFLRAEGQQGKCTPWDVGVSLLQQSVLWGLPKVSTQLVHSLMQAPSAPPMPFSQLAHAPASSASDTEPQQAGVIAMNGLGGLLHLSLLCPKSSAMLPAVLDWGRQWGRQEAGFTWRWSEPSAAGLTPLDILATLPRDSEVLQLLLDDSVQGRLLLNAALQRAKDQAQARVETPLYPFSSHIPHPSYASSSTHTSPGSPHLADLPDASVFRATSTTVSSSAHTPSVPLPESQHSQQAPPVASRLLTQTQPCSAPEGVPSASEGGRADSVAYTLCSERAAGLVNVAWHLLGSGYRSLMRLKLLLGFPNQQRELPRQHETRQEQDQQQQHHLQQQPQQASKPQLVEEQLSKGPEKPCLCAARTESDFRTWMSFQAVPLARIWCTVHTVQLTAVAMREAVLKGSPSLSKLAALPYICYCYAIGTSVMWFRPKHYEAVLAALALCRCFMLVTVSWSNSFNLIVTVIIKLRAEVASELVSSLEQVRPAWMAPIRVLLFLGHGIFYSHYGISFPWFQAALLNLTCFTVNVALERRMRHIYNQRLQHLESEHAATQ